MSIQNPLGRIDVPTDYQSLWMNLKRRLSELKNEYAHRIASAENASVDDFRRYQGMYSAMDLVGAEMDILLDQYRSEKRSIVPTRVGTR